MKKIKKLIRSVISVSLAISMLSVGLVSPSYAEQIGNEDKKVSEMKETFTDVSETDWFYEDVMELARRGIVNGKGDGKFDPYGKVTVAEFLKMAVESQKLYLEENTSTYWAQPYIDAALRNKIIKNGDFAAYSRNMTREEMAYIAIGTFTLFNYVYGSLEKDEVIDDITDYEDIDDKYKDYVLFTYLSGLITGKGDGRFAPEENLTRAEAAAVIMRIKDENRRKPFDLSYIPHINTMYQSFDSLTEEETEVFDPDDKTTWDGYVWKKSVLYAPMNIHGERETAVLDFYKFGKAYEEKTIYSAGTGHGCSSVEIGTQKALKSEWDNLSVNEKILAYELSLDINFENLTDSTKYPYNIHFYCNNLCSQSMEDLKAKHGELWDYFMQYLFEEEADEADKYICKGVKEGEKIQGYYDMERKIINGRLMEITVFDSSLSIYISNDIY